MNNGHLSERDFRQSGYVMGTIYRNNDLTFLTCLTLHAADFIEILFCLMVDYKEDICDWTEYGGEG